MPTNLERQNGTVGIVAYIAELFVGRANHIGFPMESLTLDNKVSLLKVTLAIEITYYVVVSLTKISILLMYLRFAVEPWFRRLSIGTLIFHGIFFIVCLIVTTNQCTPLKKWWDMTGDVDGHCINTTAFFYSTSSINILSDFWILALPVASLIKINRSQKEKYALIAVFGVGCFSAITSIIRLKSIREYTQATDPFLNALSVNLWSMIEINTAIICASVPALKPLFSASRLRDSLRSNHINSSIKTSRFAASDCIASKDAGLSCDSCNNDVYNLGHNQTTTHQRHHSIQTSDSTEEMMRNDKV
ncbi:hypothetical protein CFIMG_003232RA [Ceratocystis fimbriata CBS 114723]|uniref:Rhodopsin domain-containing protein n=1 Tax=Ceratocystis fimbriata CBS 114723 TaxID=1035309 RepID=A0A2C5WWW0_9PEZI|nr:hypothetical protein CFIMG_003232RA [Ceratocystis fimbriata CBS 114723]